MAILSSFKFLEAANDAIDSNILTNSDCNTFILQATSEENSAYTAFVQGKVDVENGDWSNLYLNSLNEGSSVNSITSDGIYTTDVTGISNIRISLTEITAGAVTVFGKLDKKF